MVRYKFLLYFIVTFFLSGMFTSCSKKDYPLPPGHNRSGNIQFVFHHKFNGQDIEMYNQKYYNKAGNKMSVTKLKYIVSDITFYKKDGTMINTGVDHFIDLSDANSLILKLSQNIPVGEYSAIAFSFGLTPEKNISGAYPNPPYSNFIWPASIGGGYHHMQLEGNFIDTVGNNSGYATHLGTARQITANDTIFHQTNIWHRFDRAFGVYDQAVTIHVTMHVDKWYDTPNIVDLNSPYGGPIMMNYNAQMIFYSNGQNVFTLDNIEQ